MGVAKSFAERLGDEAAIAHQNKLDWRGRVVYSTTLHSRGIDSIGRGPAHGRRDGGKFGRPSHRQGSKRRLRMRFALQTTLPPVAAFILC